jgi:hypothetical protein
MTDFRIVGIELKELGWSWGLVGDQAKQEEIAKEDDVVNGKKEETTGDAPAKAEDPTEPPASTSDGEVKVEEGAGNAEPEAEGAELRTEVTTTGGPLASTDEVVKQEATSTHDEAEGKVGGKRKAQTPETGTSITSFTSLICMEIG